MDKQLKNNRFELGNDSIKIPRSYFPIIFHILLFLGTFTILSLIHFSENEIPKDTKVFPAQLQLLEEFPDESQIIPDFTHKALNSPGFIHVFRRTGFLRFMLYNQDFKLIKDFSLNNEDEIGEVTCLDFDQDGYDEIIFTRKYFSKLPEFINIERVDSIQFCHVDIYGNEKVIDRFIAADFIEVKGECQSPVLGNLGFGTSFGGIRPSSDGSYFTTGLYFWQEKKWFRGLCIYKSGKIPIRTAIVPTNFYVSRGIFSSDPVHGRAYTFSGITPLNGNEIELNPDSGISVSISDTTCTVFQVKVDGSTNWVKQLLNAGAETYVCPKGETDSLQTIIINQYLTIGSEAQQTRVYWLKHGTGEVMDSTIYSGSFVEFIGVNAIKKTNLAGFIRYHDNKVRLIKTNGTVQPELEMPSGFKTKYTPLFSTKNEKYIFMMVCGDEMTCIFDTNGEPQAVIEGLPSFYHVSTEHERVHFDRIMIKKKNGDLYLYDINFSKIPFWWFYKYRWSIISLLIVQILGGVFLTVFQYLRQIRLSEERFRELYDQAPIAYFTVDINGKIRNANQKAVDLLGYSLEELKNKLIHYLYSETPFGREKIKKIFFRFLDGEIIEDEILQMKRMNGEQFWISLTVQPVLDINGKIVEGRIVVLDISDRIIAQEKQEKARQLAEETARLASIGVMAGGITHEINQPLNTILLNSDTIQLHLKLKKEFQEGKLEQLVEDIHWGTNRINEIVTRMRSFWIAPQDYLLSPVDLSNAVKSALQLVSVKLEGHNVKLKYENTEDNIAIVADKLQLEQIIINLVSNSINALDMSKKSQKWIKISLNKNNEFAFLEIEDNGIGLKEEKTESIFDPFYSTGKDSRGTGLGLAIVKMFVERFSGSITGHNNKYGGATFNLKFPSVDGNEFQKVDSQT